jgi:hypothetical protein
MSGGLKKGLFSATSFPPAANTSKFFFVVIVLSIMDEEDLEAEEDALLIIIQSSLPVLLEEYLDGNNNILIQHEIDHLLGNVHDHRTDPRPKRRKFDHNRALMCLMNDYMHPESPLGDGGFKRVFRLTKARFQQISDDIQATGNPFFFSTDNDNILPNANQASTLAKLLLPLKCLAYGISTTGFEDYFQMSYTLSNACRDEFDKAMVKLYTEEYIRRPTPEDLKAIDKLHYHRHGVRGMYGSLDCMHTTWKNCPKAWQGSFVGKEKRATVVLEALCDNNLWFWNIFYGSGGSLNDLNILGLSNLSVMLLDGTMEKLEKEAGTIPFQVSEDDFDKMYMLVDGIYPKYSRFVQGIKDPLNERDKKFTGWQEAARKDIERAFGVLQARFHWTATPIMLMHLDDVTRRLKTCIILHNMGVSDRVMGNSTARYIASNGIFDGAPENHHQLNQENHQLMDPIEIELHHDEGEVHRRWMELKETGEHTRLTAALKDFHSR